ncbi:hypothetical protein [Acidovorax sp. Leaf160]|uniref:hypothetical protein n=1 Tax=Acidovorax sp. Leaf160 TaxID=1736280 RepID=UPI000B22BA20|nr:hypothetical protein [Acidovorax sp. Leaf160]
MLGNVICRNAAAVALSVACAGAAHAAVVYDTSAAPGAISGYTASGNLQLAAKITLDTAAVVDLLTLQLFEFVVPSVISVRVCADGLNGAQPDLTNCTAFRQIEPLPRSGGSYGRTRFVGERTFSPGVPGWVVLSASSGGAAWAFTSVVAPGNAYVTDPSGSPAWQPRPANLLLRLETDAAAAALASLRPTPVPGIGMPGLLALSAALALAGIAASRRRA